MNRDEAQGLVSKVLDMPREGELQIFIDGESRLATRFNDCAISQNMLKTQQTLTVTGRLDQKKASLTINSLEDMDAVARIVKQVFEICRHMPDDEEVMPAPGDSLETKEYAFNPQSDAMKIETLGEWTAVACAEGAAAGVDLAGLLYLDKGFAVYADSAGGFGYERCHRADFHVTATGEAGSGWAEVQGTGITRDQIMAATKRAIDKCSAAQNPVVFEPRPATAILEPQAVGDLLSMAFWYGFDQRAKDEGRSAFSSFEGKLGDLSFFSDPASSVFPSLSFDSSGQTLGRSTWLDKGEVQQLETSRFWAKKKNIDVKPGPNSLMLSGAGESLDDLIKSTDDGILVTRFWYIRSIDSGKLSFTGMTRNGVYRIEKGEITHPVVDMRWNESALDVLKNVSASGEPVATGENFSMAMPALKVEEFGFSSLSGWSE